jgi:hypothetical protein
LLDEGDHTMRVPLPCGAGHLFCDLHLTGH